MVINPAKNFRVCNLPSKGFQKLLTFPCPMPFPSFYYHRFWQFPPSFPPSGKVVISYNQIPFFAPSFISQVLSSIRVSNKFPVLLFICEHKILSGKAEWMTFPLLIYLLFLHSPLTFCSFYWFIGCFCWFLSRLFILKFFVCIFYQPSYIYKYLFFVPH